MIEMGEGKYEIDKEKGLKRKKVIRIGKENVKDEKKLKKWEKKG